jgi:peptidoglycan/LPS O-acetylase OafA/YrhL
MSTQPNAHLDVLDGLRAIAIGMVVWFHLWQLSWWNGAFMVGGLRLNPEIFAVTGFLGVELFFFVSGFCLFYPHARAMIEGARLPDLREYVYRRAIKILPSYWLAIALILLFVERGFSSPMDAVWHVGAHLLFIHNWFHETYGSINGVFWSLGTEVQFYVLFPLVAWSFRRRPLETFAALMALGWGYRTLLAASWLPLQSFHVNQLPGVIDFFAGGMLASWLTVLVRRHLVGARWLPGAAVAVGLAAIAGVVAMLVPLYGARFTENWPQPWLIGHRGPLSLLFVVLAVALTQAVGALRMLFANPLTLFLSAISYNLYLWHQLIARLLFEHRIPLATTADPHADPQWQVSFFVLAVATGVGVSALITYGFERPLLRHGVGWLVPHFRQEPASGAADTGVRNVA